MDRRAYGRIQGLCGPRGLYVTGGQGAISRFAQMPAHLPPFIQEYATEGLAGLTCQLRHVTWPNCMPRAHCQASTHQSCPPALSWMFPSIAFISAHLLPSILNTPHALQEPPWRMDLQRLSPTLWGLSGRVEPEGLPTFLPRAQEPTC